MKIENDQITIESADISKLSTETQAALEVAASSRTVLVRVPTGAEPAEYLTTVLNQVLDSAKKTQASRRFSALRKALEEADPTKRNQAEALIEQAEAVVGVEPPVA